MSEITKSPEKKRFKVLSSAELKQKIVQPRNDNTEMAERRADKAFKLFLDECGCESNEYYYFEEKELSEWLSKFWFGARTKPTKDQKEGEHYTVNSLRSFKYAINRILRKKGHEYDITKSAIFKSCMEAFDIAIKELKEHGKGYTKSSEEITEEGKFPHYQP